LFSLAFASVLLAIVLCLQQMWGGSPIKTGLAVAPGPLMVPVFAAVAQRVAHRVSPGALASLGCVLFGVSAVILATSVGAHPSYVRDILPGWLVGGVGVGFALPTIMSAATADLPPARASTGSGVVTMSRQVGLVLGVSAFVAVVGNPLGYAATHSAFVDAWWTMAAVSFAAAATAIGMTPKRAVALPRQQS